MIKDVRARHSFYFDTQHLSITTGELLCTVSLNNIYFKTLTESKKKNNKKNNQTNETHLHHCVIAAFNHIRSPNIRKYPIALAVCKRLCPPHLSRIHDNEYIFMFLTSLGYACTRDRQEYEKDSKLPIGASLAIDVIRIDPHFLATTSTPLSIAVNIVTTGQTLTSHSQVFG